MGNLNSVGTNSNVTAPFDVHLLSQDASAETVTMAFPSDSDTHDPGLFDRYPPIGDFPGFTTPPWCNHNLLPPKPPIGNGLLEIIFNKILRPIIEPIMEAMSAIIGLFKNLFSFNR